MRKVLLFSILMTLFMFGETAFAQDPPEIAMGMNPQATYHSGDFDSIDMATGRLNLRIPLVVDHSQRGKLNFTYSVTYSSTGTWTSFIAKQNPPVWDITPPKYGVSSPAQVTEGGYLTVISKNYRDPASGYTDRAVWAVEGGYGVGPLHPMGGAESIDGSGIGSAGSTVISKNGVRFPSSAPGLPGDANGNQFTASGNSIIDTLGRYWTTTYNSTDVSGCPTGGPVAASTSTIWTIPGPANGTRTFKFCYSTYNVLTNFNTPAGFAYNQYNNPYQSFMTGVVLPDGTTWRFDYANNSYGDLVAVYPPTGGSISYTWTTIYGGCNSSLDIGTRTVTSRTVSDGTSSHTWTYNFAGGTSGTTHTVTDPIGNDIVYTNTGGLCGGLVNTIQYYSGSAKNGTLLKTVNKTYRSLPNPYIQDIGGWGAGPSLLSSVTTVWPNGQQSQEQLTYDSGFTFTDNNPDATCPCTYTSSYGLVTQKNDYDYGSTGVGPLLSTTNINYKALSSDSNAPSYLSANLLNLVSLQTVLNSSGSQMAQSTYAYDENNGSPQCVCGNLTSVTRWLNTGGTSPKTQYIYNSNGMRTAMIDPNGTTTQYIYDVNGVFLVEIRHPSTGNFTHWEDFSNDSNTGVLLADIDYENKQTTYYKNYDLMLRPGEIDYPDGGQTTVSYNDVYPFSITVTKKITSSVNNVTTQIFDGLGRLTQTQSSSGQGTIYVDQTYDADGRLHSVTNPHYGTSSATDGTTTYSYDALGRVVTVTHPDGNTITSSYSLDGNRLLIQQHDEAGDTKNSWLDGLGRTTQVNVFPNSVARTQYTYDALNNLTKVDESGSNWSNDRIRTFTYDSLSRLTSATNPESGTTTYTYDSNGNMLTRTRPAPNQTNPAVTVTATYYYDALNRLTKIAHSDSTITGTVNKVYDDSFSGTLTNTIGHLTDEWVTVTETGNPTDMFFGYDSMGRVITNTQCIGWNGCTSRIPVTYTYDLAGDLISATNPAMNGTGVTLSYSYDTDMRPMSVRSSWNDSQHPATLTTIDPSLGYWPTGQMRIMTLGNGLAETAVYNNRLEPCRINLNSSRTYLASCTDAIPNGNKQDFSYGYSTNWNNGDIWSWKGTGTQNFNRSYTYDGTNEVVTMSAPGDSCSGLSWTYDAWGNRTDQTVTGGSCGTSHVTVNTKNQLVGPPYQYDAAGNLTYDGLHIYFYDSENRIIQVDGNFSRCYEVTTTACYSYDAEGRRSENQKPSVTTDYLFDLTGRVITELQNGNFVKGYAYFNGQLLTQYANATTYFAHTDHLGSTRLLTATNQSVYDSLDYLPFGEQIAGGTGTTHKFTGQERDSETGNDNFRARYYGSSVGRFLSPDDPFADQDPSNPQSWNLYSYGQNNPLRNTDPTGRNCVQQEDGSWQTDKNGGQSCEEAEDPSQRNFASATVSAGFTSDELNLMMLQSVGDTLNSASQWADLVKNGLELATQVGFAVGAAEQCVLASCSKTNVALAILPEISALREGATLLRAGRGLHAAELLEKAGGFAQATKDFESISGVEKTIGSVKVKDLADGSKAVLRNFSSDGRPTLEIQHASGEVTKYRYN